MHSSPSFGSQHARSISAPLTMQSERDYGAPQLKPRIPYQLTKASLHVHYALRFCNPVTRAHVRLLGPCFKTGRMGNRLNAKAEYNSMSHQNIHSNGSGPETGGPSTPVQMPAVNELEACTLSITVEATALHTQARHSLPKQQATNSRSTRRPHCLWRDLREMHP